MGLTSTGFTPKSLQDIKNDITENLKIALGADIDTSPQTRIGQFIDIISQEQYSVWLGLQDVYNSFFPNSSYGASLDNVASITNVVRQLDKSSSALVYYAGDADTVIQASDLIGKTGTDATFLASSTYTITDQSNMIILPNVATEGQCVVSWDDEDITLLFDATTEELETAIKGHSKISDCEVTGGFNTVGAIHIKFIAVSMLSNEATIESHTFKRSDEDLSCVAYFSTLDPSPVIASETGATTVPAISLRDIITPRSGLSEVINLEVGITGADRETDPQLRERRITELQKKGASTLGGVRNEIVNLSGVDNCTVIENDTSFDDAEGRPPHSFECFVTGGDDDEVARAIYESKPIGIMPVSTATTRTGTVTDVNGEEQMINFSSPTNVPINLIINIEVDSVNFPVGGADDIRENLVKHFEGMLLGQDVINHLLYSPVNLVTGILTLEILQDRKPSTPTASGNTEISSIEVAILEVPANDIIVNIT